MEYKSFMEALKGKQHKIDKNKNGEIDAHDFKLLRKEEEELGESEERMARADYKVGASGRKSHKEIVFNDAESKDDDKKEMKEAKMSDDDMAERERIVKGMKKNLAGFKARYGDRAKEVMYATATKQAMKEETVEEAVQKADIPAYLRKQQGQTPLKLSDLKRKDTISDKENLAKLRNEEAEELDELHPLTYASYHNKATAIDRDGTPHDKSGKDRSANIAKADKRVTDSAYGRGPLAKLYPTGKKSTLGKKAQAAVRSNAQWNEEVEELDEKSDQAKRNKMMKNMMDASRGARHKLNNPVPDAEPEHKTARAQNIAIGRALRNEENEQVEEGYYQKPASAYRRKGDEVGGGSSKNDVPFDGPYTKTKPAKNSDGTAQSPMSRARALAKDAMKKQMKEDIDRLFEKDDNEYNYEGEMAVTQLKTIIRHAEALQAKMQPDTNLPEWVQSKITLATDYIQTASDYLHSELEEQAPVAPVPDKKYIKGTPEHKAYKATKKPINGMPTNVKETFDADGNIINSKVSYKDFAMMLEYEAKDGRYVHKGSYGGNYVDPEGADDADDKKPKQQPADKRGRGRPAGAKSGARKITGTSKLFK
jgi:hypothetical protein